MKIFSNISEEEATSLAIMMYDDILEYIKNVQSSVSIDEEA